MDRIEMLHVKLAVFLQPHRDFADEALPPQPVSPVYEARKEF
jgi:hypothetical protein